jgi:hypothetical protein
MSFLIFCAVREHPAKVPAVRVMGDVLLHSNNLLSIRTTRQWTVAVTPVAAII